MKIFKCWKAYFRKGTVSSPDISLWYNNNNNNNNTETNDISTMNRNNRIAATLYSLGTYFVSGM